MAVRWRRDQPMVGHVWWAQDFAQSSKIAAMLHMGLCTVPAYHNYYYYYTVILSSH